MKKQYPHWRHNRECKQDLRHLSDSNWTRTKNHLVRKRTLNHFSKLTKWPSCVLSNYLYGTFYCMFLSYHVCVSEWITRFTLYSYLNVKELLARSRCKIWRLGDSNWTRTQNHLFRKQTLKHLAKWTKWLSCDLSTYLYGAFDCMLLLCQVRVSEWIHTL